MNLVRIGFLSLTLLALADGYLLTSGGGFGGISGIFSVLLLILFIAALGKRTNTNVVADCPANYTHTPNDPTSCIRFFSSPTENFGNAFTACEDDGAYLLKLSTATFPFIQKLAQSNSGACSYWVDTHEHDDGDWFNSNELPIPNTPGIFFLEPSNTIGGNYGLMSNTTSFFLLGADFEALHCYICQKDI